MHERAVKAKEGRKTAILNIIWINQSTGIQKAEMDAKW